MILRNVSHWPDNTVSCTRTQYALPWKTKIPYFEYPPCLIPHRSRQMRDSIYGRIILKSAVNKQGVRALTAFVEPLIKRWWTFDFSHLRFSQRYSRWIKSAGMLWCADWEIISDVSNTRNPFIFRIKQSLDWSTLKKKGLCSSETSLSQVHTAVISQSLQQ